MKKWFFEQVGCSDRSGRDAILFYLIPLVNMKCNRKSSELLLKLQKI